MCSLKPHLEHESLVMGGEDGPLVYPLAGCLKQNLFSPKITL